MNQDLYPMIFKRRSFHLFRNTGREPIGPDELRGIEAAWDGFERLYPELRTAMRIVPASSASSPPRPFGSSRQCESVTTNPLALATTESNHSHWAALRCPFVQSVFLKRSVVTRP